MGTASFSLTHTRFYGVPCRANRLGWQVLAYLWHQDQQTLVEDMIACHVEAIVIKTAGMGMCTPCATMVPVREGALHLCAWRHRPQSIARGPNAKDHVAAFNFPG